MSSPFSSANSGLSSISKPSWSSVATVNGNFVPVNPFGITVNLEVGYGEGGYGEDGYDTPTTVVAGSATPNWTTVATR